MASQNYHNYTNVSGSARSSVTEHPIGSYHSAKKYTGGLLHLSGSERYAGFVRSGSSTTNGEIKAHGGVAIPITFFKEKELHKMSIESISGSAGMTGEIYLLKR
tara:strand:+ start:715 stop:1026 length:312 start_codon:yes stop_codon:yes gene_type:complete